MNNINGAKIYMVVYIIFVVEYLSDVSENIIRKNIHKKRYFLALL